MGKEIVYCSVCGDRIPSSDFEKGKAVTVLKRHYCKKCALTIAKTSARPGHDPTATPAPLKIRTQRIPVADAPKSASNKVPFLIAAAVGIVALLLLFYVLFKK